MRNITNEYGFLDVSKLETVEYGQVAGAFKQDIPLIGYISEYHKDAIDAILPSINMRLQQIILEILSHGEPDEYLKEVDFKGAKHEGMYLFAEKDTNEPGMTYVRADAKIRENGQVRTPWLQGKKAYIGEDAVRIAYRSSEVYLLTKVHGSTYSKYIKQGIVEGYIYQEPHSKHRKIVVAVYAYPVFDCNNIHIE